ATQARRVHDLRPGGADLSGHGARKEGDDPEPATRPPRGLPAGRDAVQARAERGTRGAAEVAARRVRRRAREVASVQPPPQVAAPGKGGRRAPASGAPTSTKWGSRENAFAARRATRLARRSIRVDGVGRRA